ncbi:MAG: hypothetical protein JOZ81_28915 [Chloroflexi bacterium]|nr:hypothetical protein [Chloroflexota bacterium]MBV9546729.1 hypothetical protein [Chloroflexota bacterium]
MYLRLRRPRLRPFRSVVLVAALLATTATSTPISHASASAYASAYKDPTGDDVVAHVTSTSAPVAFLKAPPTT